MAETLRLLWTEFSPGAFVARHGLLTIYAFEARHLRMVNGRLVAPRMFDAFLTVDGRDGSTGEALCLGAEECLLQLIDPRGTARGEEGPR